MEGRGPEFSHEIPEITDEGFSEKKAARIIEGKQQDNSQVKKRKPLVSRSKANQKRAARVEMSLREKILKAYDHNAQEIQKLMQSFVVLSQGSFDASQQLMAQMRGRQHIQEELLNALALESQGNLTEDTLSKELIDLIK